MIARNNCEILLLFVVIVSDFKRSHKRLLQIKQIKILKIFCLENIDTKTALFFFSFKEQFQNKQFC